MSDERWTGKYSATQSSLAASQLLSLERQLLSLERRMVILACVIAAPLVALVVVLALDMKFEADQARWQQRQTCLEWYRLQADYDVGPWYQKLPEAALDCGGGVNADGQPVVPGGKASAVEPGEDRYVPRG